MLEKLPGSRWIYRAFFIALILIGIALQFELRIPSRPKGDLDSLAALRDRDDLNVIFILIDTLRADRLGVYGYERPTSPVMDELATFGIRFDRVEAQSSFTKTSMASLWTGVTPSRNGVTRYDHVVQPEAVLPAERFKEAGYRTLGVFRNGWVEANFGFAQGFDVYFKPSASRTAGRYQRRSPGTHALQGSDLDATEGALELIRAHQDERFFLYVHYMDVHQYQYDDVAAEQAFGNSYSDAYDSAVHWVDRNIGRILLELEERDLFKRTLIVVSSDHGEGFYEHQQEGHARTLYREVTEVPWIIGLPFRLESGIVVRPLVGNVDIWPTVLDLVGLPPLPPVDGRSLLPLIEQAADPGAQDAPSADSPNVVVSYLDRNWGRTKKGPRPLVSVRRWPYRLVYLKERPREAELFDHSSDPTEQRDLAAEDPERAGEMRALIEEHLSLEPMPWTENATTVELDELHLNQLRALGYVVK